MNALTDNAAGVTIRPAGEADLAPFFAYLDDHLRDNGTNGTPLFQPVAPGQPRLPAGLRIAFIKGIAVPTGQPGWRRLWLAIDPYGEIAGHVDLRGRPEPAATHRAMLGMGVHRVWRRRGLGRLLLGTAAGWARVDTNIAWIDLEVLSDNLPACELYARAGFSTVARVADMLRIGGVSHDLSYMTLRLR